MANAPESERSPGAAPVGWGLQLLATLLLRHRTSVYLLTYLDWPLQRLALLFLTRRGSEGQLRRLGSGIRRPAVTHQNPVVPADSYSDVATGSVSRPQKQHRPADDHADLAESQTVTAQVPPPGPTWWDLLPLDAAPARTPVFFGGFQTAESFIAAFRAGILPMPPPFDQSNRALKFLAAVRGLPWHCPDPRTGVPAGSVRAEPELRRRMRKYGWTTTMNARFDEVTARCSRPGSWNFWLTEKHRAVYSDLHALGWAHSLEVWDGDELVGGLFGVLVGGVFYPASLFHTRSNASKMAFVDLDARFTVAGGRLIDCGGFTGDHLSSLGVRGIPRAEFLATLREVRDDNVRLVTDRLPIARLAPAGTSRQ
jgi:leucyl/phenylalanyl-tRNA--protein transferase